MNEVRIKATNKTHKQSQHFLRSQTIDLTKKKPNLHCARYASALYFDYQSDVGLLKMLKVREQSLASSPGPTQILSCSCGEKSGKGLGSKLRHDWKWWTRFRNDGNVPTHNVAGVGQFNPPQRLCQQLRTSQVPSH